MHMKKILLGLTMLFPLQAISADDSVYTWGTWSQGIQPAAGPVAHVATPAPVQLAAVNLRPNEHSAFNRAPDDTARQAAEAARQAAEAARLASAELARITAAAVANGSSLIAGSQVIIVTSEQANRR